MLTTIEMYVLLFFIFAFAGWFMESVGGILNVKKFVNRGFLIGPYCPVYGVGVVLVSLLLSKYANDIPALFVFSIIVCGTLEYFTGYIMEKLFNARWWDYRNKKFNINGRVCLETLIPFGLVATIIICKINPFLFECFGKMSRISIHIISGILSVCFIIDLIISFKIILSFKGETYKSKDNTEEISEMVKDKAEDVLMKAESDIRYYGRKYKVKLIRKTRYTRKRVKEVLDETPRELANRLENTRIELKERYKEEKEKINEQIKLKRAEYELKQKERKEIIEKEIRRTKDELEKVQEEFTKQVKEKFRKESFLSKRLIDAFPRMQVKSKEKKKK